MTKIVTKIIAFVFGEISAKTDCVVESTTLILIELTLLPVKTIIE